MQFHRTAPWQDSDPLRSLLNDGPTGSWVNPDGLTPWAINALIGESHREIAGAAAPTSALLDGSAEDRRRHRMQRRALASVVRSLPARRARLAGRPDGEVA